MVFITKNIVIFDSMNRNFAFVSFLLIVHTAVAQSGHETMPPGTVAEQAWWNLLHYTIDIKPDYGSKYLKGTNTIEFRATAAGQVMELDLIPPMSIQAVTWHEQALQLERRRDIYFIHFPRM